MNEFRSNVAALLTRHGAKMTEAGVVMLRPGIAFSLRGLENGYHAPAHHAFKAVAAVAEAASAWDALRSDPHLSDKGRVSKLAHVLPPLRAHLTRARKDATDQQEATAARLKALTAPAAPARDSVEFAHHREIRDTLRRMDAADAMRAVADPVVARAVMTGPTVGMPAGVVESAMAALASAWQGHPEATALQGELAAAGDALAVIGEAERALAQVLPADAPAAAAA